MARPSPDRPSVSARAAQITGKHLRLTRPEADRIAPYLRPHRARGGTVLFAPGAVCRDLFLMSAGLVRVFYVHEHREVNLRLLCPPSAVVALASFIRRAPSEETVQALTDVEGVMFRLADFVDEHPGETSERILRVIAELHYLTMERRLRMLQWKSARERWEYFVTHMEPAIVRGVAGVHIASYLGVRPESLSRVRRKR